jgi:hypothetical protein
VPTTSTGPATVTEVTTTTGVIVDTFPPVTIPGNTPTTGPPVHKQGSPIPTTTTQSLVPAPRLPRTGSGTLFPLAFAICCLTAGTLLARGGRRRSIGGFE